MYESQTKIAKIEITNEKSLTINKVNTVLNSENKTSNDTHIETELAKKFIHLSGLEKTDFMKMLLKIGGIFSDDLGMDPYTNKNMELYIM